MIARSTLAISNIYARLLSIRICARYTGGVAAPRRLLRPVPDRIPRWMFSSIPKSRKVSMRLVTGVCVALACAAALSAANPKEKKRAVSTAPANGVRTPGVQIPFADLKSEMEFEGVAAAGWVAMAETVVAPNAAGDGLLRLDARAKEKKLADPVAGVKQPCAGAVSAFGSLRVGACGDGTL